MANVKKNTPISDTGNIENVGTKSRKPLNLDEKVTVKNFASWTVAFAAKSTIGGDIQIPANGSIRLVRAEIIAQVQAMNKLFTGIDGRGNHATLYVEDEPTRLEIGFDDEELGNQVVLTDEVAKKLLEIPDQKEFENQFEDTVKTRAEKYKIIEDVKRLGINDFRKIRFIENYTGHRVD